MLVLRFARGRQRRSKQAFRQNDSGAESRTIGAVAALADAIEPVAGRNYPSVRCRPVQVPAEIFENGRVFGRNGGEVVEGFVDACRQARSGYIMTQDSAIHHLREDRGLWD